MFTQSVVLSALECTECNRRLTIQSIARFDPLCSALFDSDKDCTADEQLFSCSSSIIRKGIRDVVPAAHSLSQCCRSHLVDVIAFFVEFVFCSSPRTWCRSEVCQMCMQDCCPRAFCACLEKIHF